MLPRDATLGLSDSEGINQVRSIRNLKARMKGGNVLNFHGNGCYASLRFLLYPRRLCGTNIQERLTWT